jgi:GT2 family glycosyltransferase
MGFTQIIILNWNAGRDTWKCLESVFPMENARIAVLDNGSTDDSVSFLHEKLKKSGRPFFLLNDDEISTLSNTNQSLILVRSPKNLGFAAGVNLILRPLKRRGDVDYVWLLNNDALAEPESLNALRNTLKAAPDLGFAGSVIMDGTRCDEVQCFGVRYYKWLGVAKMQFKGRQWSTITDDEIRMAKSDFQHGASLLVSMQYILDVGLMDEDFFLYSEEHDWQERARAAGFGNVSVAGSRVFHLGSMSTANSKFLFYYNYCKSSVLYSRKHHSRLTAIFASAMLFLITVLRTRMNLKSLRWTLKGMKEAWLIKL